MLDKQATNYLFILKSAEISPCKIQSLLDYDRDHVLDPVTLKRLGGLREKSFKTA